MKRAFTLLELLIVVAIIAVLAAFLWPVFPHSNPGGSRRASCMSNLKQIGLGFLMYVQDYDQQMPSVRIAPKLGWADAIFPYVKSKQLFECPSTQIKATTFATDYFYNDRLDCVIWDKLPSRALTIMVGDGDDNAPTWNSWTQLPADATTNSYSPLQRHNGTANYLFADGHVKSLKPSIVSSTFASPTSRPTFAIR